MGSFFTLSAQVHTFDVQVLVFLHEQVGVYQDRQLFLSYIFRVKSVMVSES